jgi:hypothetical protein
LSQLIGPALLLAAIGLGVAMAALSRRARRGTATT